MTLTLQVVIAALIVLLYAGYRVRFWLKEGRKMQESGHLAPAPSIFAKIFWATLTHVIGYLCVGPIKVIGRENLRVKGRKVFAPNHTFALDFDVVAVAIRRSCRYMTKTSELKGLRGAFGAWTGAIPVNTKVPGGGEAALNSSIESLLEGTNNNFLIFPQGALKDNLKLERGDFRTGFARLARSAWEDSEGEPCYVIPMAVFYKRDPQMKPWSHLLLAPLRRAFGDTNYGAVVVIGQPIAAQNLPEDPEQATDVYFEYLRALHAQAIEYGSPRMAAQV